MKLKILSVSAQWVFMLCISVLLLTATIGWAVNSNWLYMSGLQKYDASQLTEEERAELEIIATELETIATRLINYFNSTEEHIDPILQTEGEPLEVFTPDEIIHFKDVKGLIRLNYLVLLGTVIYLLMYTRASLFWHKHQHWRRLAWGAAGGSGITLALMLALGLGTLLSFDRLFLQFHLMSFANEFWSAEGYMRVLFPPDFWYDTVLLCAGIIAGLAVILGGIAGGYLLSTRKKVSTRHPDTSEN